MKFNIEKYKKGLNLIQNMLIDLSDSYDDPSSITRNYVCIPSTNKENNSITFDITNTSGSHSMELTLCPHYTIATMFDKQHRFLYDYSVYDENNTRTTTINFANGIGVSQKIRLNTADGTFSLIETDERFPVKNLVNIEDYSDPLIDNNLFVLSKLKEEKNGKMPLLLSFTKKNANNNNVLFNVQKHEDLISIR